MKTYLLIMVISAFCAGVGASKGDWVGWIWLANVPLFGALAIMRHRTECLTRHCVGVSCGIGIGLGMRDGGIKPKNGVANETAN